MSIKKKSQYFADYSSFNFKYNDSACFRCF